MKKLGFCALFVAICFVAMAGNAFGEAGATSRSYSIDYSFTPSGASEPFTGYQDAVDQDYLDIALPSTEVTLYTLYARGVTSQSDYRSEVGSGGSVVELGAVDFDYFEVRSQVENTQRFYLSDDDGDGEDDIQIGVDTFMYGKLGLYNPYSSTNPLDITFDTGGFIEVGYRLSVTAESCDGSFWNTMMGTGGVWSHEFASSEQTMTFDTSGITGDNEIVIDDLTNNMFGSLLNIDAGKPFDVTISLETWIVGQNFSTAGLESDRLVLISNLHDNYPDNNLCYMELTEGGTSTAPVPEPSAATLLLCCLIAGTLLKLRKRAR
ncbi:MAG: hypothetical protein PVH19_04360 [Planctomycetia bacterium]|jgi:hypothetical protein